MKASLLPRKTANLSESIHQQLNMYALAASAAGVSILALSQPADAKIVYTPADVRVDNQKVFFDLNHDGIPDFSIRDGNTGSGPSFLFATAAGSNAIVGVGCYGSLFCPLALPKGARIGPKQPFGRFPSGLMASYGPPYGPRGRWRGVREAYLGIKFVIKGNIHFGWARVKIVPAILRRGLIGIVTGYAYETIRNKPIIAGATKGPDDAEPTAAFRSHAPEPATLSALALGAPGLSIWRRDEPVAATSDGN